MLERVTHLSFEASRRCNLAREHPWCPSGTRVLEGKPITPEEVTGWIDEAVALGFQGWVGFHFYNEPLLSMGFMRAVMASSSYPRFMLWTNGTLLTPEIAELFDWVVVTNYGGFQPFMHPRLEVAPLAPDRRLETYTAPPHESQPCRRALRECAVDNAGGVHLCCQDWRDTVASARDGFAQALETWHEVAYAAASGDGPEVCRTCTHPT